MCLNRFNHRYGENYQPNYCNCRIYPSTKKFQMCGMLASHSTNVERNWLTVVVVVGDRLVVVWLPCLIVGTESVSWCRVWLLSFPNLEAVQFSGAFRRLLSSTRAQNLSIASFESNWTGDQSVSTNVELGKAWQVVWKNCRPRQL